MIDIETVRTAVTRTCCRATERSTRHVPRFAGVPDESNPDAVTIVIGACAMSFTTFIAQTIGLYPTAPFIVAAAFGHLLDVTPEEAPSVTAEQIAERVDTRIGVMTAVIEDGEMALWATERSVADVEAAKEAWLAEVAPFVPDGIDAAIESVGRACEPVDAKAARSSEVSYSMLSGSAGAAAFDAVVSRRPAVS